MYRYKDIGFRPIEERDLETIRKNRNDMDTLLNLGNADMVSQDQQKNWWKFITSGNSQQWYCVTKESYDDVIGVLRINKLDSVNRNAEIGADIFSNYRGKGYGEKTYNMVLEYLFNHMNMHTIYLKVAAFNAKAIGLYKKVGFEDTGFIPESIFRNGSYWNDNIMALTAEKYFGKGDR